MILRGFVNENRVTGLRLRVDEKGGAAEREERMISMFIREMNEKFTSLDNMFKEMGYMNERLFDALMNGGQK